MTALVVDTSALVAMLRGEDGWAWVERQLAQADDRSMSAASAVELGMVLEARRPQAIGIAGKALRDTRIRVVPVDEDLAERALDAWRRFGKGRHRAALNFGNCFSYALAERERVPILCVGADFSLTDLQVLTPPRSRRRR